VKKDVIVSFEHAFHGGTLGSSLQAEFRGLKTGYAGEHDDYVQVPFPATGGEAEQADVCGVRESAAKQRNQAGAYRRRDLRGRIEERQRAFMPVDFGSGAATWCTKNRSSMIYDEVQAGSDAAERSSVRILRRVVRCDLLRKKASAHRADFLRASASRKIMDLYGPRRDDLDAHRQSESARPPRWPT